MANTEHITGLLDESESSVCPNGQRPLSIHWITDDLLQSTIEVWSQQYKREVKPDEAIEILMNVKRFGEALLNSSNERTNEL